MLHAFVTGEKGFIAKNFINLYKNDILIMNSYISKYCTCNYKGEIDFVNTPDKVLKEVLKGCNVIIHNGAIVGTDVCALHPSECVTNNVYGTYKIASVAKELNVPVIYLGTTVIYNTQDPAIQAGYIEEDSPIFPRTLYATTKYEGELIVKAYCQNSGYAILRPLFCYGGEGDMNSLIAKTTYNCMTGRNRQVKIFLDPTKVKDYMHVNDFCSAIFAATDEHILTSNRGYNISADDPIPTSDIVEIMQDCGIETSFIKWVPETDYLGNHRVSNEDFKKASKWWKPKIALKEGILKTKHSYIEEDYKDYNPFEHLDRIEKEGINIESHYNFR